MAAAANTTTLSVDYTGRDYYAIRQQLIERVQARVPEWKGDDPSDFGLAIIEAFSYMGDLVNYYIDRVANEAYILTATQRESLLNLASLFGYRPANYVNATTTLTITSYVGYQGGIGAAIIEEDFNEDVDSSHKHFAKVIVPNDHPFTVDGEYNRIKVSGFPGSTTGVIGDTDVSYETSVFNGTFDVAYVGYENSGQNVVWYRPTASVTGISVMTATVTRAVGASGRITYTAEHDFLVGQIVTITGLGTATGASLNLSKVKIDTASPTEFTVLNATVGTSSGTGTVTDTGFTMTLDETTRSLDPLTNQKIILSSSGVSAGNNYNGKWSIFSYVPPTDTVGTKITVSLLDSWTAPAITYAVVSEGVFRYSLWSDSSFGQGLTVGQKVTVTDVKSSANTGGTAGTGYNLTNVAVQAVKDVEAAVSRCKTTTGNATYYVSEQFAAGDIVTLRNLASASTASGAANVGFNLSNKAITNTSATVTASIQNVTTSGSLITYECTAAHGFKKDDFVTITGVTNDTDSTTDRTDVYNLKSAKIKSVGGGDTNSETTFTVVGYWTQDYSDIQPDIPTATLYAFTINSSGVTDASATSSGAAISKYFDLTSSGSPGTWNTSANAKVAPVLGGTYSSGGEITYSDFPIVIPNSAAASIVGYTVVPKGSTVGTQVTVNGATKDVIFSTQSEVTVPYRGSADVLAKHGEDISLRTENAAIVSAESHDIAGELLGYSTGDAAQLFSLKEIEVSPRSVRVFVDTGTEWEEWTQVEHIQDYAAEALVFQVNVAADETVFVEFGDGISGKIPFKEAGIKAVYLAGGGTIGNVAAGALQSWKSVAGAEADTIRASLSVTNYSAATGGTNPESNDSIRYNTPRALRSLNRAVTLEDFAGLALSVDGIVKANAYAESRSSVSVYIAPSSTDEETPGVDNNTMSNTTQMDDYISLVSNYLSDKKQIGTTVTVLPPTYSYVHVEVTYSVLPQYNQGIVEEAIKARILDDFSYDNLDFQDTITPEEIEFKLRQVDGVSNIRITGLYRDLGSGRNSLIGDPYEIFVFTGDQIGLTALHGVGYAEIVNVNFFPTNDADASTGTVTKVPTSINGSVYTYSLVLPYGTTKLLMQVSTNDNEKASVSINDNSATYDGTEYYEYTFTKIPDSTINVTVVAEDGLSTNSYKFKTTIASS
ncbi:Baseplate protein J-like [uncultured Caudovirales phage]|uniref:Baseplate protein J-like n=1 Tax=uncultured Caudovirales phage TaxID=2100421 RepID=A0A6J5L595_9CAUD|nr:Baseplate protein J-like [uncultured Caudovirales phage]